MYAELLETWKREIESAVLQKLAPDFYSKIADYLRHLREEGRMLDKGTVKARLLKSETRNAKRMLHELIQVRYRKLVERLADTEEVPSELLAIEEGKLLKGCLPTTFAYQNFAANLLKGQTSKMDATQDRKNVALRFLKDIPEIVGANMKIYGPFKAEDVASVPSENGSVLVKQGLAERISIN
jgi:DNA replication factor GINS